MNITITPGFCSAVYQIDEGTFMREGRILPGESVIVHCDLDGAVSYEVVKP